MYSGPLFELNHERPAATPRNVGVADIVSTAATNIAVAESAVSTTAIRPERDAASSKVARREESCLPRVKSNLRRLLSTDLCASVKLESDQVAA